MHWLHRIKIKYQLLLVVLVAVLPALLIILKAGYDQRTECMSDARTGLSNYAQRLAAEIGTVSQSCKLMLEALAHSPDVRARAPDQCSAVFADFVRSNPHFVSFTIALPDGAVFAAGAPMTNAVTVSDRLWFRDAVRRHAFAAGEYVVSRTAGKPIFSFSYPVYDTRGALSSVMQVGIALKWLDDLSRQIVLPHGASFTVTDRNAVVLVCTGTHGVQPGDRDAPSLFAKMCAAAEGGSFITQRKGVRMVGASSALVLPGPGEAPYLHVRVEIPEQVVLQPVAAATRRNLLLLLVAALLAFGGASFVGKRMVGNRVAQLAEFARQVAARDRAAITKPAVEGGELGELARVLDDMSCRLSRTLGDLRESEERFRALVETTSDLIWETDAEGRYVYVSPQVRDLLGWLPAEVLGKTPFDFMPPEEARRMRDVFAKAAASRQPIVAVENRCLHASGRELVLETSGLPVHSTAGVLTGYRGIDRDISERVRAAAERLKVERQMQQTQKMESLGVLAGGVAHDFNNLLVGIMGNVDIALADLPPASPVCETLREVEKASRRAADLCRQMLAYSGKGKFVVQAIDLRELVAEMGRMLEVSVSKKITIRYAFAPDLPAIEADATQIRQVVMNLIINAAEAIGEGAGTITVTVGARACDQAYLFETFGREDLAAGRYVTLDVTDSGCGMDAATLSHVFEPFFTTKFRGRGLGLAAVLGIVRGHKGAIRVYSEPGRGTTFKLLLPAVAHPAVCQGEAPDVQPAWRGTGTVLLVDDEETVRLVGARMLERFGFRVLLAADGAEALVRFREAEAGGERIACVIVDLTMPRMDGEETFRELRRLRADLPVIISSGYNEQDVTQRFVGRGLAGFIQKPYQSRELALKLQAALHA